MKQPHLISIYGMHNLLDSKTEIDGRWVPARPMAVYPFWQRWKLAWMVFTGKADALVWPKGQ